MSNQDIRRTAASAGIKLWEIADKLGITDGNFSRKLRKEMSEADKKHIMQLIRDMSKEDS